MFIRATLAGLLLAASTLSPALACPAAGHDAQAQSCMSGYTWDEEKGGCVAKVTG